MEARLEKSPPLLDPEWLDKAAIVALGSNLSGNSASPEALLEAALSELEEMGLGPFVQSTWWGSKAWPDPHDPDFINGVAFFQTDASPRDVLAVLLGVEFKFGRTRGRAYAPRTLDFDLIAHGRTVTGDRDLILPHPRAHERLFVMGPLAEVAPSWRHPVLDETAETLAARAKIGLDARPLRRAALHNNR